MANIIVGLIILLLVVLSTLRIVKAKKKGQICMGCSDSATCGKNCHCNDILK